ncbi:hypothetical protein AUEXF2481DRAFT_401097 [Aureobasidium subglaciale EXF-2481]|uniref:F-box domain-containing protein n=1 Tax=Aureobasidium subglaciale (strain EXF-2481) TaxID=1043005 RepID=A0A074YMY3_AURSE|nr:uncharacterized protein AUEXF2481DRAFT_401097 [Aureobasidium subglaciale EXF-2481]KEQ99128.1 hypothetical protein AUEXF2481DRAFT_401097 [Aureobasidium subglaciale EXF-2481]
MRGYDLYFRPTKKPCHIGKLPPELMMCIADNLPLHNVLCLALTSKDIFYSTWICHYSEQNSPMKDQYLQEVRPDIETPERLPFLEILLKEKAATSICDYCQTRVSRPILDHIRGRGLADDQRCPCQPRRTPEALSLYYKEWSIYLDFEHFRQVMYRRRLGTAYGTSPESLTFDSDWNNPGLGDWLTKLNLKPIFADSSLVLHATHRIIIPVEYLYSLHRSDSDTRLVVLNKLMESSIGRCHCNNPTQISTLLKCTNYIFADLCSDYNFKDLLSGSRISKPHNCPNCLTQYVFALHRHSKAAIFEIVFDTWTNLGECKWTFSPEWLSTRSEGAGI